MEELYRQIFEAGESFGVLMLTLPPPHNSLQALQAIISSQGYMDWKAAELKRFLNNSDTIIAAKLYSLDKKLQNLPIEHKNYPALLREYGSLLSKSTTLIEKLNRQKQELDITTKLKDLEIVIDES